jgi:endoribonuclease Dicer
MVFSSSLTDAEDKSSLIGPVTKKPPVHVHIPPELLCLLDIKRDVYKSMYLLPSLMYRIESLMLSSQLRAEINGHTDIFKIQSSLVCPTYSDFVEKIQISLCFY